MHDPRDEVQRPLVRLESFEEVVAPEVVVSIPDGIYERRGSVVGLQMSPACFGKIGGAPHRWRRGGKCTRTSALVVAELVPTHRIRSALGLLTVLLLTALINGSQRRIGVRRMLLRQLEHWPGTAHTRANKRTLELVVVVQLPELLELAARVRRYSAQTRLWRNESEFVECVSPDKSVRCTKAKRSRILVEQMTIGRAVEKPVDDASATSPDIVPILVGPH